MIKNLLLFCTVIFVIYSCGKKGDPEYKGNSMIQGQKITI